MKKWSTMTLWLLVSAAVMGCGGASDVYVPLRPARWIPMDDVTYAFIGREALEKYGYEEIIRLGVEAGFLRYPESKNTQNFVGQTLAEAARQAGPIFTKGAVMASITALMDSPAPGPADVVALGMLFAAIAEAGYVGVQVWTSSTTATATPIPIATAIPTATATTTTTAPPIALPRVSCPPCKTVSGRIVPVGTTSYRPLETPAKPQHGIVGPHHNLFTANQAPRNSPVPCKCFWQPIGAVSPADLPTGAIPIEPFANF